MASKAFDYVIVGAGSAGCVLAHRLSEDPGVRVLLLEAGGRDTKREIHIPAAFPTLYKTEIDWAFQTAPERHLEGRRLFWPRGKVLGGSSSINAMLYIRGHRDDYDGWRDLGNPGWGWDDVLPYFKRAQNQERGASALHGVGGPLNVAEPRDPNLVSRAFVAAGRELGWPANNDFNGERQEGVGLYQVTQRRGRRCSAAVAYLRPARRRRNLQIRTGATVLRVLMEGGRAIGVEIDTGSGPQQVRAEREVILAAGAIGSPQLLMLSGIGEADHLSELGLSVIVDLPGVGGNLQDHLVVSVVYGCRQAVTLDSAATLGNMLRYLLTRRGPFTSTVCEGGAFVRSRQEIPRPDLQYHFVPAGLIDHGFDTAVDPGFNLGPTLLRPRSTGAITLRSADPRQAPEIRADYLSESADLDILVAGVKLARRLAATQAFADYADVEVVPGSGVQSDSDLADFVRRTAHTLYHPVGTCRMGPEKDLAGDRPPVVDPELRVHGVAGLRVVDASVMPEIVAGNTNAPTIMIAEKASDLIRGKPSAG